MKRVAVSLADSGFDPAPCTPLACPKWCVEPVVKLAAVD